MNISRPLIARSRKSRFTLLTAVIFSLLSAGMLVWQALSVSTILNLVFLEKAGFDRIRPEIPILVAVIILRALAHYLADHFAINVARQVKNDLRDELMTAIRSGDSAAGDAHGGELSSNILEGIEALDGYFSQYLPQLAIAALVPLMMLVIVLPLDPLSALVMFLTAPLIPLFMILIGKTAEETTRSQWAQMRKMSVHFLDTLQGLTVLKTLNQIKRQIDRMSVVAEQYRITTLQVLRITFLSSLVLEMVGTLATAIIAVQIGLRLLSGGIDFRIAFFILVIAPDFYQPIRQLGLRFHTGMNALAVWERISSILPELKSVGVQSEVKTISQTMRSVTRFESLSFVNVSYRYPDRLEEAVQEVSFNIQTGEFIAIVGPSGSGKSTLVRLLAGMLQPEHGQIALNGEPIGSFSVESWRKLINWVPQKPHLFMGTLRENLALARPEAADRDILEACQWAGLTGLLDKLPDGLNTNVGEQGTRLSGGEAQRVSLARAFLKGGELLVMDEPTANLDLELEADLVKSIRDLSRDKTVIAIAHRLETVRNADRIFVMEKGRLVQVGDHQTLLDTSGIYQRLILAGERT